MEELAAGLQSIDADDSAGGDGSSSSSNNNGNNNNDNSNNNGGNLFLRVVSLQGDVAREAARADRAEALAKGLTAQLETERRAHAREARDGGALFERMQAVLAQVDEEIPGSVVVAGAAGNARHGTVVVAANAATAALRRDLARDEVLSRLARLEDALSRRVAAAAAAATTLRRENERLAQAVSERPTPSQWRRALRRCESLAAALEEERGRRRRRQRQRREEEMRRAARANLGALGEGEDEEKKDGEEKTGEEKQKEKENAKGAGNTRRGQGKSGKSKEQRQREQREQSLRLVRDRAMRGSGGGGGGSGDLDAAMQAIEDALLATWPTRGGGGAGRGRGGEEKNDSSSGSSSGGGGNAPSLSLAAVTGGAYAPVRLQRVAAACVSVARELCAALGLASPLDLPAAVEEVRTVPVGWEIIPTHAQLPFPPPSHPPRSHPISPHPISPHPTPSHSSALPATPATASTPLPQRSQRSRARSCRDTSAAAARRTTAERRAAAVSTPAAR